MALHLSNNSISLAGEFAVLSQLALRGFDATMTLGNTKSVDILASNPNTGKMLKIQVKTHYGNAPSHSVLFGHTLDWVMLEKHEKIVDHDLYYCFVHIQKEAHNFRFFVVPNKVVAIYVREQHKLWLSTRENKMSEGTKIRQFRIGLDDGGYRMPTPLAKYYENKWEF